MTTKQDMARRMTAAAGSRASGAKPTGRTAVRTKPVRITIDLDPADYLQLKRWLEATGAALHPDFPRPVQQTAAVKAMIHATITDDVVNDVVTDLLRRDQGTGR